jgi:6-phospho-beta-glucosidase
VGAVDDHQLALMLAVKAVERETIAAARERSRDRALLAFALHPLVDSVEVARRLLDGYAREVPELSALFH